MRIWEHIAESEGLNPIFTDGSSPSSGKSSLVSSPSGDTRERRNNFLVKNSDVIFPLLPESNNLQKILEEAGGPTKPYESLHSQPQEVRGNLRGHQMDGLAFLVYPRRNGAHGILGDEMGLGKTLQILSLFQYVVENEKSAISTQAPFLVVCPLSVLRSWINEARKWTELRVVEYHGSAEKKAGVRKMLSKRGSQDCAEKAVDVVVTTYDTLNSDTTHLVRVGVWKCVVLDEGHGIALIDSEVVFPRLTVLRSAQDSDSK